jgi:membrane protein
MIALIKETFYYWWQDNVPRLAAALAYYTILSTAPLIVISVAVAGLAFGQQAVQGQLAREIRGLVGAAAAQAIQALIQGAHEPATGVIATILSIVALMVGASSVVIELRDSLNLIWGVPPPPDSTPGRDVIRLLKERFLSALAVMGAGCLLLLSLAFTTLAATIGKFFRSSLPMSEWILHIAVFLASFAIVMLFFAAIYKFLPDVRLRWTDVFTGAAVTSLLYTIGKQLIALYLGRLGFESTYGAAWGAVLFLAWVYYSAQLFFLGAEFTKVYARKYGSHGSQMASRNPEVPQKSV